MKPLVIIIIIIIGLVQSEDLCQASSWDLDGGWPAFCRLVWVVVFSPSSVDYCMRDRVINYLLVVDGRGGNWD